MPIEIGMIAATDDGAMCCLEASRKFTVPCACSQYRTRTVMSIPYARRFDPQLLGAMYVNTNMLYARYVNRSPLAKQLLMTQKVQGLILVYVNIPLCVN